MCRFFYFCQIPFLTMKQLIFLLFVASGFFSACSHTSEPQRFNLAGEIQGTYYSITYYDAQGRNLQVAVDSVLDAVDQSVSLWVDQSILSRVNSGDTTVELDQIFLVNYYLSKEVSALTNGYFDFTIGPLAQAWGFHRKQHVDMSSKQVDSLRQLVDYQNVTLHNNKLHFEKPGMRIDFNAIAQGYTTDLIADLFDSLQIKNFIIDVGGEILARNKKPDGSHWRVGIEHPTSNANEDRTIQVIVNLENLGLATSGSYRKYFEKDGKRFSHAISPKTGYPVDHNLLSVTVLAKSAGLADALATAFLVMGLDESKETLKRIPDVEAFFIYWTPEHTYETYSTEGMQKIIVVE